MKATLLILLCIILHFVFLDKAGGATQELIPFNPADLELEVKQPQEAIHPFQAIRVRVTVRNVRNTPLPRSIAAEQLIGVLFKRPNDDTYSSCRDAVQYRSSNRTTATTPLEFMRERVPTVLEPREMTSISFAFAACWRSKDGRERLPLDAGDPIFSEPGTYLIKLRFLLDGKQNYLEKIVKVKVLEPQGQNRELYDLLKKDRPLASALMRPVDTPSREVGLKLKALLEKYPNTAYTDYIRFALIRASNTGVGLEQIKSRRVARAMIADELEAVIKDRYDPKLQDFVIDPFPFRPNAMLLYANMDMGDRQTILRRLHEQHPDSLEWIDAFASLLIGSSGPRRNYDLESLGARVPENPAAIAGFHERVWRTFRKK